MCQCLTGRSKLICFLLIPSFALGTDRKNGNKPSAFSEAKTQTSSSHDDTELLQLQEVMPEIFEDDYYVNKLMMKYGDGSGMTFEGFEHLLHKLGLGNIVIFDHSTKCHKPTDNSTFQSFHDSHNHSKFSESSKSSEYPCINKTDHSEHAHIKDEHDDHDHSHDDHDHSHDKLDHSHDNHNHTHGDHEHSDDEQQNSHDNHDHSNDEHDHSHDEHDHSHDDQDHKHSKRSTSQENKCLTAKGFLYISKSDKQYLTKDNFYDLCPSLIYQISTDSCHDYHEDIVHCHSNRQVDDNNNEQDLLVEALPGNKGPSSIPFKVWGYSTISVIIISLVGFCGVAIIPVMQKVIYNHMLQFLVALTVGALIGDALLHLLPHAIVGHVDGKEHELIVYKGLLGLLGIFLFFIIERLLTIFTDHRRKIKQKKSLKYNLGSHEKIGEHLAASAECDEMIMSVCPNKAIQGYAEEAHSEHCTISFENSHTISHHHGKLTNHDGNHNDNDVHGVKDEERVDMLPPSKGHGHSHSHCVDGAPNSIAAVAWMMLLGDGIHKFSDGLAIGAAFSNSITGGLSTSIAMFCHEFPHEIGDCAMLLRAGMTPKQAVVYNCLSSILSFLGMLVGVAIGNIENASLWIFAIVGGMFLYISLVDMLPELSSVDTKRGENPFCHLFLQIFGMSIGAGIMLVIALYEHQLKSILN